MSKLDLKIVTPEKLFFEGKVDRVIVRGIEGDMAIMKDHIPIATPLRICKVRILIDGEEKIASVIEGYITVLNNQITIVTDAAEWPEEIDEERAKAAMKRAEERLAKVKQDKESKIDAVRAEAALKRAINRLDVIDKRHY